MNSTKRSTLKMRDMWPCMHPRRRLGVPDLENTSTFSKACNFFAFWSWIKKRCSAPILWNEPVRLRTFPELLHQLFLLKYLGKVKSDTNWTQMTKYHVHSTKNRFQTAFFKREVLPLRAHRQLNRWCHQYPSHAASSLRREVSSARTNVTVGVTVVWIRLGISWHFHYSRDCNRKCSILTMWGPWRSSKNFI